MNLSTLRNRLAVPGDKALAVFLIAAVSLITAIVIGLVCMVFSVTSRIANDLANDAIVETTPEAPILGEVGKEVVTFDAIARVMVSSPNGEIAIGGGILIGDTLVTSEMLFSRSFKSILVIINDQEITAKLVTKGDGLAILEVDLEDGIEISENGLEMGESGTTAVWGRRHVVTAVAYVANNDNWVLVDGDIPIACTGGPVMRGGELVGIIVGINRNNREQAIMMNVSGVIEYLAAPIVVEEKVVETPYNYNYNDYYDNEPRGFFQRLFGG